MEHFNRPSRGEKVSGKEAVCCWLLVAEPTKSASQLATNNQEPTTYKLYPCPQTRPSPASFPRQPPNRRLANGYWPTATVERAATPAPAGFGVLIQDADGAVLAELSEFLGIQTNNYAEYSGLLAALDFALSNGHHRLRVVSDSELMVKQIQGKYQVKSPILRPLFDQARKKIAQLDGFEITHALRHKNKDADRLANQAMDRGMRCG